MTDDIVTRLRLWASTTQGDHVIEELHRAADEIEMLRKQRDYYREMCLIIADKNFVANGQIYCLQSELKQLKHR